MTPRESEAFVADLLGFTLQPGSGNQIGKKGDLKGKSEIAFGGEVLVEHKFIGRDTRAFTFSRRVAMKIAEEAMLDGRVPFLTYHAEQRGVWLVAPSMDAVIKKFKAEVRFSVKQYRRIPVRLLIEVGNFLLTFETAESIRLRNWMAFRVWKP